MENFVAVIIMMASLLVAVVMMIKNAKSGVLACWKTVAISILLLVNAFLTFCDVVAGGDLSLRLPFDILLSILAIFALSSSVMPLRDGKIVAVASGVAEICMSVYYLLCARDILQLPSGTAMISAAAMTAVFIAGTLLYGISCRIRDVGAVMAAGNAWDGLCLGTDAVYVVSFLVETIFMLLAFSIHGAENRQLLLIFPMLLAAGQAALGARACFSSVFVLARRHEQRIAGALKTSKEEHAIRQVPVSETYREVYSRVVVYFEEEKPYLNGDLTINDVVKGVYTNKLYISKAISQCTGKNFCQFVNYHRVMYSVEHYRLNPEMRVADMWQTCGFNSIVSYNMAFKLFMGENPSDWCRKEKSRLVNCKK